MSQRPTLKLKLSTTGHAASQPVATPSTSTPKLTLKFGSGTPKTATAPVLPQPDVIAKPAKAPRKPKKERPPRLSTPTSKKRDFAAHSEDDDPIPLSAPVPSAGIKKIKLNARAPTTPFIRMKAKGKPPHRPLGVGYDSEASDREVDPAIEEEFILRMAPGEDCDYLRKAVEEKRWGPRSEGGADVRMKFLGRDGRRAVVTIRGRHYAACLVDLPCVIEGMKSWDRRGWWKSADICQMLLVLGQVTKEDDALDYPLPGRELDKATWQYAHGLTPPMRWVRKRRFRKRVSNRTIEAVEEEVERLLRLDEECEGDSRVEVIDLDRLSKEQSRREESAEGFDMLGNAGMQGESEYGDRNADGEVDENTGYLIGAEVEDDGLEADLMMAMMEGDADEAASTPVIDNAPTIVETSNFTDTEAPTPPAATSAKEDSDDESSGSDANASDE
ncbi:MAG: hypothetical protein Q9187_007499, partial [Circinaria calcarea]